MHRVRFRSPGTLYGLDPLLSLAAHGKGAQLLVGPCGGDVAHALVGIRLVRAVKAPLFRIGHRLDHRSQPGPVENVDRPEDGHLCQPCGEAVFHPDAQVGTPALAGDIGQPRMAALALGQNDLGDVPIDARAELLKAATLRLPLGCCAHEEGEARKLGEALGAGDRAAVVTQSFELTSTVTQVPSRHPGAADA